MAESSSAPIFVSAVGTKRPPSPASSDPPVPICPPPVPQGWTRCHAYVEHKHRYCRQQCQGKRIQADGGGPRYCGNHQHLFVCTTTNTPIGKSSLTESNNNNKNKNSSRSSKKSSQMSKRIPCPIDPTHHIPADKLEKHVLICPKIKQQNATKKLHYYRDSLNTGGHGCIIIDEHHQESSSLLEEREQRRGTIEWAKRVALCVLKVHEQAFSKNHHHHPQNIDDSSDPTPPTCNNDNHLSCLTHEDIVNALPLKDLSSAPASAVGIAQQQHNDEKTNLARAIQAYNIKSGGPKHVHQQASLLGHLRQLVAIPTDSGMMSSSSPSSSLMLFQPQQQHQQTQQRKRKRRITIMELGAGRGMMGLVAAGVLAAAAAATRSGGIHATSPSRTTTTTTTRLILVERSGCRSKADRILRNHKNHAGPFNTASATKNTAATISGVTTTQETCSATTTASTATTAAAAVAVATSMEPPLPPPVKDYMNLKDVEWARVQCDLAHVDMKEVLNHSGTVGGGGDKRSLRSVPIQPHQQPSSTTHEQHDEEEEEEEEEEIHVVAKHLCGVGTDLALKSLQSIRHSISTCLLATCCHGICSWKDYVGRDYLQNVMIGKNNSNNDNSKNNTSKMTYLTQFGESEFELLCQWSAGTVATNWTDSNRSGGGGGSKKKGHLPDQTEKQQKHRNDHNDNDDDDEDNEHRAARSNNSNRDTDPAVLGVSTIVEVLDLQCGVQGLGRACQRLIDYGRLEYMRHILFENNTSSATAAAAAAAAATPGPPTNEGQDNLQLVYYVPPEVTPQNAVLMGRRRR